MDKNDALYNSFESNQTVRFNDTDAAGIVYFGAFATYFDESFHDALRSRGIDWNTHRDENFLLPIVEQNCKFYHPLRAHDHIKVFLKITNIGTRSFTTSHDVFIEKSDKKILCASGNISRVIVGYHDFIPRMIPLKLLEALKYFRDH